MDLHQNGCHTQRATRNLQKRHIALANPRSLFRLLQSFPPTSLGQSTVDSLKSELLLHLMRGLLLAFGRANSESSTTGREANVNPGGPQAAKGKKSTIFINSKTVVSGNLRDLQHQRSLAIGHGMLLDLGNRDQTVSVQYGF